MQKDFLQLASCSCHTITMWKWSLHIGRCCWSLRSTSIRVDLLHCIVSPCLSKRTEDTNIYSVHIYCMQLSRCRLRLSKSARLHVWSYVSLGQHQMHSNKTWSVQLAHWHQTKSKLPICILFWEEKFERRCRLKVSNSTVVPLWNLSGAKSGI